MFEWIIMWCMYKHKTYRDRIWALFEKVMQKCTCWEIIIHVIPLQRSLEIKTSLL